MNRLPKKRGITQDGEDKSLILRQIHFLLTLPAGVIPIHAYGDSH
jgi:hypothetical protein